MADDTDVQELRRGSRDLVHRDLRAADFSGMDLSERDFSSAHLEGAVMAGSNLSGSILTGAKTSGWNAEGANLSNISAEGTVIFSTNLRRADFRGAQMSRSHFQRTDLTGANLVGADFRNAVFNEGTTFEDCIVDATTLFDGATIFRPLSRQPAFRFYTVERGRLVRLAEDHAAEEPAEDPTKVGITSSAQHVAHLLRSIETVRAEVIQLYPASGVEHARIGHNGPPDDVPWALEERDHVLKALDVLKAEVACETPNHAAGRQSSEILQNAARKVSTWAARKADLMADEFVKQMGKSLADGRVWIAAWLMLSGKLESLVAVVCNIIK